MSTETMTPTLDTVTGLLYLAARRGSTPEDATAAVTAAEAFTTRLECDASHIVAAMSAVGQGPDSPVKEWWWPTAVSGPARSDSIRGQRHDLHPVAVTLRDWFSNPFESSRFAAGDSMAKQRAKNLWPWLVKVAEQLA